jgi:hypothetical protein
MDFLFCAVSRHTHIKLPRDCGFAAPHLAAYDATPTGPRMNCFVDFKIVPSLIFAPHNLLPTCFPSYI